MPDRAAVLNARLLLRRGQSAREIAEVAETHCLLQALLKVRILRESAIKMELARLRRDIADGPERIGAPYGEQHFLPTVTHGFEKYRVTRKLAIVTHRVVAGSQTTGSHFTSRSTKKKK